MVAIVCFDPKKNKPISFELHRLVQNFEFKRGEQISLDDILLKLAVNHIPIYP